MQHQPQRITDPGTGRVYFHDPGTGRTWWADDAPEPAPTYFAAEEPPRKGNRGRRLALWLPTGFIAGLILGVSINGAGNEEAVTSVAAASVKASATPAGKPSSAKPVPVVVVKNAKTFGDAFDKNQVAAEKAWNGKRVQLTATVSNITEDHISLTGVTSEWSLTQVSCELADAAQALTVQNEKPVTVVGTVDGQTMGVITLKDCVVK